VIGHGCTDPRAGLVTAVGSATPAPADGTAPADGMAKAGGAAATPPRDTAAITPSTRGSLTITRPPPWSRRTG
jgi:hypothetical protein